MSRLPAPLRHRRWRAVAGDPAEPALRRADALAALERPEEALELLMAANRGAPDPEVERRIVDLHFDERGSTPPRSPASWPPAVPDLFPDEHGVPEVDARDLTVAALQSGILHHGCLLVRGFVGAERAAAIRDGVDRAFAAHDAWRQGTAVDEHAPWFSPRAEIDFDERHWVREGGGVLAVESPHVFFDLMDAYAEAGLRELVAEHFGEVPLMLGNKWTLRRVAPDIGNPDWHQDGSFMGADIRSLDIWLALSDCGTTAPGLDVVPRRFDQVVETGTGGANLDWTVGREVVARVGDGTVLTPEFAPGDTIFFDHLFLHRTGIHPGMTHDRYAVEAWFASPSSYPPGQLPIRY